MITTLGKVTTNGFTSTANDTSNLQPTVNATTLYRFQGDCFNCGRSGHTTANCYNRQFDNFIERNQSRNLNQPLDFRGRSNSRDRNRNTDRSSSRDQDRNQDRNRDRDRENDRDRDRSRERKREKDRDRYDQSPSPYPARDRSRSRDSQYPKRGSHYEPKSQSYRSKHNDSVANSTALHKQQEEVPTASNIFRRPPEWELIERQEEDKRNEQSKQLTDNSRNRNNDSRTNDDTNYDTKPVRDSRRVTYANRP